jgi:hypothetical protein
MDYSIPANFYKNKILIFPILKIYYNLNYKMQSIIYIIFFWGVVSGDETEGPYAGS